MLENGYDDNFFSQHLSVVNIVVPVLIINIFTIHIIQIINKPTVKTHLTSGFLCNTRFLRTRYHRNILLR